MRSIFFTEVYRMTKSVENVKIGNVLRITGAYIAWVIGSGFATGQEVLRFFASYGYMSYAVVGINLIGFMILGYLIMLAGYRNRETAGFNHFNYFCGKKLGTAYSLLVSVTILLLIPVLISGAGATLQEYYAVPKPVGSAVMTAAVLAAYLMGFEKMINIISKIGPVIILFSLFVGLVSMFKDAENWQNIPDYETTLMGYKAAPFFWMSGFLYLGLNFFPGSTYFSQLGASAGNEKEVRYGTICGGVVLMLSIIIMNTAILLNGSTAAVLDIPVLYLARNISGVFGGVFSAVLVAGIFSSCSVMMWSVCTRFIVITKKKVITAVGIAIFGYVVSLFSFGDLIGTVYPVIGYIGLVFLGCVIYKGIKKKIK